MKKIIIIILMASAVLAVGVYCLINTLIGNSSNYNSYSNSGSSYSNYSGGGYSSGSSYSGGSSYDRDADYVAGQFGVSSDSVKGSVGALADAIR
ncbi:MAG: hypothetical protein E7522_00270 [Ruminococcaceae bacterium]|nr:hypothetical protein [Oscillospiraceae bacterium]